MKIISLNVNRFSGMKNPDFTNGFESLDQCPKANEITAYVKEFFDENPGGIVFLQEVPFMESPIGKEKKRALFEAFQKDLLDAGCKIILPVGNGIICTLAIVKESKENNIWEEIRCPFCKDYTNRFVEVGYGNLRILSIHAPDDMGVLDKLQEYAQENKEQKLIILGDFNIATNVWRAKQRICEMRDAVRKGDKEKLLKGIDFFERLMVYRDLIRTGYSDAVKDDPITYFTAGTTIDHVLSSPALEGKVTADVIHQDELELSDHAAIIVDIDIQA